MNQNCLAQRICIARRRVVVAIVSIVWTGMSVAAGVDGYSSDARRADQQFATYAFAHEFGSGVYDFAGRTLQVYTLPFGWSVREAAPGHPGLRLKLPVTLGFLDFQTSDVVTTGLPDSADSISFVPGVEVRIDLPRRWALAPYVQFGRTVADQRDVEAKLLGVGVRAERTFESGRYSGMHASELIYSGVRYDGDLPNDDLVRLRNGVQMTRNLESSLAGRPLQLGLFSAVDLMIDPPTGPVTGIDVPVVQLEAGMVLGTGPAIEVWGVPLPRIGLSYRFAGDLSSWRIVFGAPF